VETEFKNYLDRIISLVKHKKKLYGVVVGRATYRTILDLEQNTGDCTCLVGFDCKHVKALKYAFEKGKYTEGDSEFKAILSLITATIPLEVKIDIKKLFKSQIMRASCFLNDYMKNGGYTNLIEAVGIIYSLTLLAKSIKENVKKLREVS